MARQHVTPLFIASEGGAAVELAQLGTAAGPDAVSEAAIQELVHLHPECLPIAEIDPIFCGPVPICRELNTRAGAIDNFLVTPSGLPILVECKLWRNPEGRREVVGQILDYAKELSRWSSSDLQREVRRGGGGTGDPVLARLRAAGHDVDERDFNDALTLNLRRGRFLLLIVGDGIREGVEAIAEYLQAHAGLHFTLGLVELPIYRLPDGGRLVVPRIMARTHVITRTVIAVPDGMTLQDEGALGGEVEPPLDEMTRDRVSFWTQFVSRLSLDDPEQPIPKPSRQGYVAFMLPAPSGSCWLNVYRNVNEGRVGLFLSYTRNTVGERAVRRIVDEEWDDIQRELGGTVQLLKDRMDRMLIQDELIVGPLGVPENRERAVQWLRSRSNDFVNSLRPRVRAAAADIVEEG